MTSKVRRLDAPRIAYALDRNGKPRGKRVDYLNSFETPNLTERQQQDLARIISCIQNGRELDERYYRSGIDTDYDELLSKLGVKHLHLGGQGSDCILYLIEYSDHVLMIEVSNHKYLDAVPPGLGLPHGEIQKAEKAAQAAADMKAAKLAASREKLLSRKKEDPAPDDQ